MSTRAWFKNLRKMSGLTQQKLSQMAGCSQEVISKIERGYPLRVKTAKAIADVLGIDWTRFYEEANNEQQPT